MKGLSSLLTAFFLLSVILHSNSQTVSGVGFRPTHPPFEAVGVVDGETLYSRAFDFVLSNTLELFSIENGEFIQKEQIQMSEDYIQRVFIYDNRYFFLVSDRKTMDYSIVELDKNNEEINRISILPYKDPKTSKLKEIGANNETPRYLRTFQSGNKVAVSVKESSNRFVVINLETMEFSAHASDLKRDIDYSVEDCLFGEGLDAIFSLFKSNYENEALVICKEKNHHNLIIPYQDKSTGNFRFTFKFVIYNDTNYLVSHYLNKSKKEYGYTLTPIPDFNFTSLELVTVPNTTLNNPAIWTEGQFKKIQKGKFPIPYFGFRIVSIQTENGFLLINSQYGRGNILVSRIDMNSAEHTVAWSFLSHFFVDYYFTFETKSGNQNFVSFLHHDQMHLFYNIQINHINTAGSTNLKDIELFDGGSFSKVDSRVMHTTINLQTGEFASKITEPLANSEYKGRIISPCYGLKEDQVTILLYNINYATKQFSKPTIHIVPLD